MFMGESKGRLFYEHCNLVSSIETTGGAEQSIPTNRLARYGKTFVDKVGALIAIIIAIPLAVVIAIAIKLEGRGPVFHKQIRSGKNRRPFTFYKFRTMNINAENQKAELANLNEMSGPVFKMANDPRVTYVGRFLRKSSMDELPQFINVLRGEMSLVGPRPPLPEEVEQYEHWQYRRLSVKPGITCIWQVSGRNNIDFDKWIKLDLEYIDNWSLWNDMKIIAKTFPAVFKGDGAV